MTSYTTMQTQALGELLLVANDTQLIGVYYTDSKHAPPIEAGWRFNPNQPVLQQAQEEIAAFLDGERTSFSVPLHFAGTKFQQKIWTQLALIPFGETISYSELARRVGAPSAIRAAGSANGKNPLSIIIPCHRVISKDGTLGGYAGRLNRKRQLLEIEKGSCHEREDGFTQACNHI
ncbi:MAG TPA: methylated-DNA--[protein]-cysteine S-methyltransferase [Candidatus Dormibacteraeota bacterium]|nr:methylated-DNA--[protein]-cysteine S-methyltransferase [Candidatus Dormibacteraeota bacterium]